MTGANRGLGRVHGLGVAGLGVDAGGPVAKFRGQVLPLSGALPGSLGGTLGAAQPRKPRPGRSWSRGVFVISS